MTTGKTTALTRWTFVGKVMPLLFNMLSRLVITVLPRSKCLLISWLQSPSAGILEPQNIKSATVSTVAYMLGFSNPQRVLLFSFQIHMIFFLNICILLKYSWLTVFQVHNKVIQLYIYTHIIFRFFSIIGYYKILTIVPCAIQ